MAEEKKSKNDGISRIVWQRMLHPDPTEEAWVINCYSDLSTMCSLIISHWLGATQVVYKH